LLRKLSFLYIASKYYSAGSGGRRITRHDKNKAFGEFLLTNKEKLALKHRNIYFCIPITKENKADDG
jgi:hypothetical protein